MGLSSWIVTVGPIVAALVSAVVTAFVFFKTRDIQSRLKEIDGQLKRFEIRFQYHQSCVENCDKLTDQILGTLFKDQTSIRLKTVVSRLRIILQTLDSLTKFEEETLTLREFGTDGDFLYWKEQVINLAYQRLFKAAVTFSNDSESR